MRFGDRAHADRLSVILRRNQGYHEHLRKHRLTFNDPLVRYFGSEVFHDGEIRINELSLSKRLLSFTLRNVRAVNYVCDVLIKAGQSYQGIRKADFRTTVELSGVDNCSFSWSDDAPLLIYHQSELSKADDLYQIEIACHNNGIREGYIKVRFAEVRIEDISRKLERYVSPKEAKAALHMTSQEWARCDKSILAGRWP